MSERAAEVVVGRDWHTLLEEILFTRSSACLTPSQGQSRSLCREPLSLLITFKGNIFPLLWQAEEERDPSQSETITKRRQSVEVWSEETRLRWLTRCYFIKESTESDVVCGSSFKTSRAVGSNHDCVSCHHWSNRCSNVLAGHKKFWQNVVHCAVRGPNRDQMIWRT